MLAPLTLFLVHAAVAAPPGLPAVAVPSAHSAPIVFLDEPFRQPSPRPARRFHVTGAASRLTQAPGSSARYRHASVATRVGAAVIGGLAGFYVGGTVGGALTSDLGGYAGGALIGTAVGAFLGARLVR